jgi:hypothetical protein
LVVAATDDVIESASELQAEFSGHVGENSRKWKRVLMFKL